MTDFPLCPEELAREIDIPLKEWPLKCHGIAMAVLQLVPVKGMRIARGHFNGYISPKSQYRSGCSSQHSWLVAEDGRIVDPTRWAMESPDRPYIYIGENDEYDEAGLQLNARIPPMLPMAGPSHFVQVLSKIPLEKVNRISRALGGGDLTTIDISSKELSNLGDFRLKYAVHVPPDHHDDPVEFYSAMADAGLKAMIKIDLWNLVMEPEKLRRQGEANRWFELPEFKQPNPVQMFHKLCCKFLSIEEREITIESELEEIGYTLEDLHKSLNDFEIVLKHEKDPQFSQIPRSWIENLVVISSWLLGKGYGVGYRIEAYAASYGYNRKGLDALLRASGERVGYDNAWI